MSHAVEKIVVFFESLTPESVQRFSQFYTEDAYFKDPFNEVRGIAAVQDIFAHMFRQVREPRFVVGERLVGGDAAMLVWDFSFRAAVFRGRVETMRGVTHLRFAVDGRVAYHRDYWDAAEELYMKLPAIGCVMRGLRRAVAA